MATALPRPLRPQPHRHRSGLLVVAALLALGLSAGQGRPQSDCPPIEGADTVIGKGRVLLLGELHGTAESPAFVAAVSCHALRAGLSVTVALELPQAEEGAVGRFLDSSGQATDRAELLRLPFWAKSYQDGRSSQAMLELLDELRSLRQRGQHIRVILLDRPEEMNKRDAAMASRLLAAIGEAPDDFFVTLTGNLHNRTAQGSNRMGERVASSLSNDRITSLNVSHSGGTAWICEATQGCGALRLRGRGEGAEWRVSLHGEPEPRGYDGIYYVGEITASPPAKGERSPPPQE